ncbi:MAG: phytoene/squalene synthase family protein [Pseudomonadota bacterium]
MSETMAAIPLAETVAGLDDAAACAAMIRGGSKSFHAASLVLPRRVRLPAYALYAFCRLADDAVDLRGGPGAAARLLDRLGRLYAGKPQAHPADRAFAEVVQRHRIPMDIPAALIEGLAWDEAGRRFETLRDVEDYSARVAATVGVMMTLIMGERRPEVLARACDLGTAMQLSNIARDVGEDARAGRLYLPRAWLRAEGLEPDAFLAAPVFSPAIGRATARLLDHAEMLYARALPGIAALPWDCRPGISAARLLYREIGREVARRGYNSVLSRAVVPGRRKARLLAAAVATTVPPARRVRAQPPLPANAFLIDAVADTDAMVPEAPALEGRLGRALDIFVTASLNVSNQRTRS